jgi:hypothetical protein
MVRVKVAAVAAGDGGGGIATALGTRCFGVSKGVRLFVGVVDGRPTPMPEPRPPVPGFGVFREDGPRFEIIEPVKGEIGLLNRVGLPVTGVRLPDCPVGLVGSRPRLPVRFIPNRMSYRNVERHSGGIPFKDVAVVLIRGRAEGVTASSSTRDVEAGVTRPLEYGVYRVEFDGVMRPEE